jgi:hypothetical protein
MLHALLHGKLSREHENLEDVLTSNVFGILRYTDPRQALLPFLSSARSITGADNPLLSLAEPLTTELEFWRRLAWSGGVCEPDVLLRINSGDGRRWLIGIEIKFRSGKSSSGFLGINSPQF